jgi:hypothetical protein
MALVHDFGGCEEDSGSLRWPGIRPVQLRPRRCRISVVKVCDACKFEPCYHFTRVWIHVFKNMAAHAIPMEAVDRLPVKSFIRSTAIQRQRFKPSEFATFFFREGSLGQERSRSFCGLLKYRHCLRSSALHHELR